MGRKAKRGVLQQNNFELQEIEPLTKSQLQVFESDKHLLLHGCAGTGKTFISLYLALDDILKNNYNRITIVRSIVPTRDIGFLPGREDEKAKVYEQPYIGILTELFGRGDDPYSQLKMKGLIDFTTTSFMRGITFRDSIVIVDECQNMTYHELDSIITRMDDNSRIIFCGDFYQSDLKGSGINKFMSILKKMPEFDFVEFGLEDIVRSALVKSYLIEKYKQERE